MEVRCLQMLEDLSREPRYDHQHSLLYQQASRSIEGAVSSRRVMYNRREVRGSQSRIEFDNTIDFDAAGDLFLFIGGRNSLANFLIRQDNAGWVFVANRAYGTIGLILQRKKRLFKKNKTIVAVCHYNDRTKNFVTPIREFSGKQGVHGLDDSGGTLSCAKLGSIVRSVFELGGDEE